MSKCKCGPARENLRQTGGGGFCDYNRDVTNNWRWPCRRSFVHAWPHATRSIWSRPSSGCRTSHQVAMAPDLDHPLWLVPTYPSSVQAAASANVPIESTIAPTRAIRPLGVVHRDHEYPHAAGHTLRGRNCEQGWRESFSEKLAVPGRRRRPRAHDDDADVQPTRRFDLM